MIRRFAESSQILSKILEKDTRFLDKGTYLLEIISDLEQPAFKIGSLGCMDLNPGTYYYIGSAFGPGNLKARLERHLASNKNKHWHIDYLLDHLVVETIWCCCGDRENEHIWAQSFASKDVMEIPLRGFGSSDCSCETHLFFTQKKLSGIRIKRLLSGTISGEVFSS
ncbi:MAG: GIY-YIG nuclease family protein [Candidatus Marinimicrobia bacterium]|nr:GIY-YIG nuclease family protein [Candidatus Neomarinimicrobiota bacterium]HJL81793.1 GIY-YIG nuclease family protein [Gammaproteobacteria bacterium]